MKRRSIKKLVVYLALALILGTPVWAFLGFGDIVFDPAVYGEALEQVAQLSMQYAKLVDTYLIIRNQYDQMVWMAKRVPVDMVNRYRALATVWRYSSAADTFGKAGPWLSAINTGDAAPEAYAQATEPLQQYGDALNNLSAEQAEHLKTDYTTLELADGANVLTMQTIGELRDHAAQVQDAVSRLESDSLSSDPDMNTEIAVLNKINAADLISVRNAQDTNKVLVSLAEAQIIEAKRRRDAEARAVNQHIRFVTEEQNVLSSQAAHASEAMLAWRMP
jgi:hypothetical protein